MQNVRALDVAAGRVSVCASIVRDVHMNATRADVGNRTKPFEALCTFYLALPPDRPDPSMRGESPQCCVRYSTSLR